MRGQGTAARAPARESRYVLAVRALVAWLVAWGLAVPAGAAPEVRYRVVFDATWSSTSHPQDFPSTAHFSPLVGGVHDGRAEFWRVHDLASLGIQRMAEQGQTSTLVQEILDAAALGEASSLTIVGPGTASPGSAAVEFTTTRAFPLLTLVTMVAPSPDWFAGVRGLPLLVPGAWRESIVLDLVAYDAGTDSGTTFTSANLVTDPHVPIFRIDTAPLATDGYAPPVGRYTITIVSVDGAPPDADPDADGLTNVREAALGSEIDDADTDDDGVLDPLDNCPLVPNAGQADDDADRVGQACDVCPSLADPEQADFDRDGEGDPCDADDSRMWLHTMLPAAQGWHDEPAYDAFHLYRGDLALLRSDRLYTQDPGSAAAERFCGLASAGATDGYLPPPDAAVFYVLSGEIAGVEQSLGRDSDGNERPNANPCP
jgi:hypothetical protein